METEEMIRTIDGLGEGGNDAIEEQYVSDK